MKIRYIKVQISRRIELWIELFKNNNKVNFYQFKHYPTITRREMKKVAIKKLRRVSFRVICKRRVI